jgi:hypothetical protein
MNSTLFYFYQPSIKINVANEFNSLKQCLVNSSFISPSENGFLSVINKIVYFYSAKASNDSGNSQCNATVTNADILFVASRVYHNIDITYYFNRSNTIIIKSSYETINFSIPINDSGTSANNYVMTSCAMT